jgi:hypothetical protein
VRLDEWGRRTLSSWRQRGCARLAGHAPQPPLSGIDAVALVRAKLDEMSVDIARREASTLSTDMA